MVGDGVDKIHFRGNLQDVVASLWSGLREEESGSRMTSIFLASCVRGGGEDGEQSRGVDDHFCSDLKRPAGHSSFRTCSIRQRQGLNGEGRGGWEMGCKGPYRYASVCEFDLLGWRDSTAQILEPSCPDSRESG